MLDLITQVRNLALDAELKGQKELAAKLRAVADEEDEATKESTPRSYHGSRRRSEAADRPPA